MTYQETTYCPNCNHEVIVPAEHGDDPIDCPGCGKAIAQSALVPGWSLRESADPLVRTAFDRAFNSFAPRNKQ